MEPSNSRKGKPCADNHGRAGAPKAVFDMDKLATLCQMQCTDVEIAAFFNVDKKTVQRHKADPVFAEVMENNRKIGKVSLRRSLYLRSLDKNQSPALLIFACKNILDMSDKLTSEITGKDGGPIELTSVREKISERLNSIHNRLAEPKVINGTKLKALPSPKAK